MTPMDAPQSPQPTTPPTEPPSDRAVLEFLAWRYDRVHTLFQFAVAALIILSGGLNVFLLKQMRYEAWKQFVIDKVDIEESLMLQDLYRSVKREAALLGTAAGYDVVLVDDSQGELAIDPDARMPRRAQVLQQIAGRRMLHVNKQIDITDDLVQRMNNAFKAVGPKPQN